MGSNSRYVHNFYNGKFFGLTNAKKTGACPVMLTLRLVVWKGCMGVNSLFTFMRHPFDLVEGRPGSFFRSGRNIQVEGAEFIAVVRLYLLWWRLTVRHFTSFSLTNLISLHLKNCGLT
jgi:hypothetical protein